MKKVEQISISGYAFMIDIDAQDLLENYLKSLTQKFGNSTENDMMLDIENRVAELFQEKTTSAQAVVDIEMVRAVITQIGTVSSIEIDSMDTKSGVRFDFEQLETKKSTNRQFAGASQIAEQGINAVCTIFSAIIKIFAVLIIFPLLLGVLGLIIASVALLTVSYGVFQEGELQIFFVIIAIIPWLLSFAALTSRILNHGKRFFSKWITIIILFIISLALIPILVNVSMKLSKIGAYNNESVEVIFVDIDDLSKVNLYIDDTNYGDYESLNNNFLKNGRNIHIECDLDIEQDATLDKVKIVITKQSDGSSRSEAYRRAMELPSVVRVEGNDIYVNLYPAISASQIIRDPDIDIDIYYPASKVILNKIYQ